MLFILHLGWADKVNGLSWVSGLNNQYIDKAATLSAETKESPCITKYERCVNVPSPLAHSSCSTLYDSKRQVVKR